MVSNQWSKWWFIVGGSIHGTFKQRQWKELKKLAESLPKLAWDHQQQKIDDLEAKLAVLLEELQKISKINPNNVEICATGEQIIWSVRKVLKLYGLE